MHFVWVDKVIANLKELSPVFNFAQVPFLCMFRMPSNSGIKAEFQKKCMQNVILSKKKSVHQLDSYPQPPECKSVSLPIELFVLWFFDGMLLEFSPLLCLQPAAECDFDAHGFACRPCQTCPDTKIA